MLDIRLSWTCAVTNLLDRPVQPLVGIFPQPLLGDLVEMHEDVKGAVTHEEVLLEAAHYALVLAFRP